METVQKGSFTLKQIFQENWESFLLAHKTLITWYMAYNVWKVMNCREPDGLGFATFACPDHPCEIRTVPRTCKSRFCSVCAKIQSDKWVADINQSFPNCPYFHITFTVPSQFRELLFEKRELLNAVFLACTETLISFCKEQGFLPAITAVLHTFGSDLKRHVHIHIIMSAGGLKLNAKAERYTRYQERKQKDPRAKMKKVSVLTENPEWISYPRSKVPYKMLRKRYQALLIKHLKEQIRKNSNSDNPDEELKILSDPMIGKAFFDDLKKEYKNGFYVHISKERTDLKQTAAYIGRYARRPPISELRIKDYTGDYITYEFKDYNNNGSKVLHTLKTLRFIERLVRHIPPHYFNVIRHYGLLANRVKSIYSKITDKLLGKMRHIKAVKNWRERQTEYKGEDPLLCKICQKTMVFVSNHLPIPLATIKSKLQFIFS